MNESPVCDYIQLVRQIGFLFSSIFGRRDIIYRPVFNFFNYLLSILINQDLNSIMDSLKNLHKIII